MRVADVLDRIETSNPRRRGEYFEAFVQNLLKQHFERIGKTYVPQFRDGGLMLDGYVTDGIEDVDGPVGFEIMYVRYATPSIMISQRLLKMNAASEKFGLRKWVVVAPFMHENVKKKILASISPSVMIWGEKKLNELICEDEKRARAIVRNLFKLDLENEVNKQEDWKTAREKTLASMREAYAKGKVSMVLGAGVSCSAGLPDWSMLLKSIYASFIGRVFRNENFSDKELADFTDMLMNANDSSAIAMAQYLKTGLSCEDRKDTEFIQTVKEALYAHTEYRPSKLVEEIVDLCLLNDGKRRVKSVITYNFDNLMEKELEAKNVRCKAIYDESGYYDVDEFPVYHVHGYLPNYAGIKSGESLIFSEEDYHKVYADAYHWSNLIQLVTFRECDCIMIGLSMSDPNLRRLLEISSQKCAGKNRHFVFLKRLNEKQLTVGKSPQSIDMVDKILRIHHTVQEMMLKRLDVSVIWYNDYDDIPVLLEQIKDVNVVGDNLTLQCSM